MQNDGLDFDIKKELIASNSRIRELERKISDLSAKVGLLERNTQSVFETSENTKKEVHEIKTMLDRRLPPAESKA